jgi:hypothetical protein
MSRHKSKKEQRRKAKQSALNKLLEQAYQAGSQEAQRIVCRSFVERTVRGIQVDGPRRATVKEYRLDSILTEDIPGQLIEQVEFNKFMVGFSKAFLANGTVKVEKVHDLFGAKRIRHSIWIAELEKDT